MLIFIFEKELRIMNDKSGINARTKIFFPKYATRITTIPPKEKVGNPIRRVPIKKKGWRKGKKSK